MESMQFSGHMKQPGSVRVVAGLVTDTDEAVWDCPRRGRSAP